MSIRQTFIDLYSFLQELRRSGTTTLIRKVSEENDVYVLVPTVEAKKIYGKNAVTLHELGKMKGCKPKPILLDNFTLIKLSELSTEEFLKLDAEISERNDLINNIKDSIALFERKNGAIKRG